MKLQIIAVSLLIISLAFGQDEIKPRGNYVPSFFAELLDAEVYSPGMVYIVGVGGFVFMDVSDMANPQLIGRYDPGSIYIRFYNGRARGNLAMGAARTDGLYLINLIELQNPTLFSVYNAGISYESVDFQGDFAYGARHNLGLEVLHISDPYHPVHIRDVSGMANTWDVFIEGDYLYVADGPGGLKIFSIAQPANPQLLATVNTTSAAREVQIGGQKAFVALGASGFDIIDVSDPANPQFISNYASPFGIVNHLEYSNNRVFTATWELVEAVDVSDPANPVLIATEDTPQRAMGIGVSGNQIFVTDWTRFRTYDFTDFHVPDIHVKPTEYDFGFQGVNIPISREFTVYNLGETHLVVNDVYVNNHTALFSISPTSFVVSPGNSGNVNVTFTPNDSVALSSRLIFSSNDFDETTKQIQLYGGQPRLSPGDPAPDFTLNALDGNTYTLSGFQGKVVILAFFASW